MSRFFKKKKTNKINNINKNYKKSISSSINKIKENEKKYMTILVIIFMIIFCLISYFTFRVNNKKLSNISEVNSLTLTANNFLLTNNDIKSDSLGLKSSGNTITITNNTNELINYKLKLVRDIQNINKDNCSDREVPLEYIRYSIDGVNVSTIVPKKNGEIVIITGCLKGHKTKKLNIKLWLAEDITRDKNYHFHGYFTVEKLVI